MVEAGYAPASHNAKDLLHVHGDLSAATSCSRRRWSFLVVVARSVVGLQDRGRLRLFVRPDDYGRFLSCLVYLPRDRYNTDVRLARPEGAACAATGGRVDRLHRAGR
jgi:glutamate dehydrogenase